MYCIQNGRQIELYTHSYFVNSKSIFVGVREVLRLLTASRSGSFCRYEEKRADPDLQALVLFWPEAGRQHYALLLLGCFHIHNKVGVF